MAAQRQLIFLSDSDVRSCALTAREVNDAVEAAFRDNALGKVISKPQVTLELGDSRLLLAKTGALRDPPFAGIKWLGVYPGNAARGLPDFHPVVLLSDAETGMPLALLDGRWITGVRTAAISAVSARYLARARSNTLGIIACGLQARTHLAAFAAEFPLRRVVCWSRTRSSAEKFALETRLLGLVADVVDHPQQAIADADLVASLVGDDPNIEPFLDADWLKPGSFLSLVDLGRPWLIGGLRRLDKIVTDDLAQSTAANGDQVVLAKPFHAELGALVIGNAERRTSPNERNAVNFNGIGFTDTAVAAAVYLRARERGIGTSLSL
jgi:ornithine cyclodeaminase/alanine dehydrogenase-like protein (mu-crystallin family)